ncbi:hypothetical protein [Roseomonas sp. TAS13]|uniref:hypothetical protein n=1 Tax=Roseomonas sp. TAS13 TaxID=1926319 RepID=UPI0011152746|nr:hypothetical protein [Roseomonas sp. TAS13]
MAVVLERIAGFLEALEVKPAAFDRTDGLAGNVSGRGPMMPFRPAHPGEGAVDAFQGLCRIRGETQVRMLRWADMRRGRHQPACRGLGDTLAQAGSQRRIEAPQSAGAQAFGKGYHTGAHGTVSTGRGDGLTVFPVRSGRS